MAAHLRIGHDDALQNLTAPLVFNGGGIRAGGAERTIGNDLMLNADFTLGRSMNLSGEITLTRDLTLISGNPDGSGGNSKIFGDIQGNYSLTVTNGSSPEVIHLLGNNTFTELTIREAEVVIQNESSLGAGSVTLDDGTLNASNLVISRTIQTTAAESRIVSATGNLEIRDIQAAGSLKLGGAGLALTEVGVVGGNLTVDYESLVHISGNVAVTNVLSIREGGQLWLDATAEVSSDAVELGHSNWSYTRLRLSGSESGRSVLETGGMSSEGSGSGTVDFDGGILRATKNNSTFLSEFNGAAYGLGLILDEGGAWIDSNGFAIGTASVFAGSGGLTKLGAGTLTLSAANIYTGVTTVSVGTLLVNGSLANTSAVEVEAGATLGGRGTIGGLTAVSAGGHLAPGTSPGTLTFDSGLLLEDGAILDFELGTLSDHIRITGGMLSGEFDGQITLNLSNSGGFAAGTYTLIDFTGASLENLDADSFVFGSIIDGYTFDVVRDGTQFQLMAEAVPEPSVPLLIALATMALVVFRQRRMGF